MTHQSHHQTNGASLEDCHTNFYALTDLCGIKWRKLVSNDRPSASSDPLDDPVLRSYSRCLAADILCVWRRVASINNEASVHPPLSLTAAKELWIFWYGEEPDLTDLVVPELLKANEGTHGHGSWENGLSYEGRGLLFKALHNLIERSLLSRDVVLRLGRWFVQPCNSVDDTPTVSSTSAAAAAAALSGSTAAVTGSNFLASGAAAGLLAHNAAAVAAASNGNERVFGKSNHNLSFAFAFFVHGDSTVCASIDLREHPAVRRLTVDHLNEAILQQAAATANQQAAPPPPLSKAQTPLTSPGATGVGAEQAGQNGNNGDAVPKPRRVILAPFGMSGTLTGQVYRMGSLDAATQKALDDWCAFYPLTVTADNPDDLPVMVEVVTGGVKLRYPTKYVLVSDMDDFDGSGGGDEEQQQQQQEDDPAARFASIKGVPYKVVEEPRRSASIKSGKHVDLKQQLHRSGFTEALGNDLGHPLSMHLRPTVATVLPERVWQDCILNPLEVGYGGVTAAAAKEASTAADKSTTALPMVSPSQIKQEPGCEVPTTTSVAAVAALPGQNGSAAGALFTFIDPTQKSSCSCTKCKRGTGGRGGSSSSGSMTSSSSGAAAAVAVGGASNSNSSSINSSISSNSASGGGGANSKGSSGSSSRSEKSSRPTRIPFHKRVLMAMPFEGLVKVQATQQQSHRLNKSRPESGGKGTSAAAAALVAAGPSTGQPASKSTSLFNILPQRTTGKCSSSSTSGSSSSKHQSSANSGANESLVPMTSCGNSPGSAEPSPHGNATGLSQQSLPSELLPMSSPCVDQQQQQPQGQQAQQQQQQEKLLNSENSSTSNNNKNLISSNNNNNLSSQVDAKSSPSLAVEDRLGASEGSSSSSSGSKNNSSSNNNNSTLKVNSSNSLTGKRKMDFNNSGSSNNSNSNSNSANYSGIASSSNGVNSATASLAQLLLKRPTLMSQDYENIVEDELEPQRQLLYDYSSCDAWFNAVVKRCRVNEDSVGPKPPLVSSSNKASLMCPNNELYAMHQRQLQLRREQQQQKSLSASAALSSSTGILLGSSSTTGTNSPSASGASGNPSNTTAEGVSGSGATSEAGGFSMMSPTEMPADYQVESPSLHDSKTGILAAEDEGGGNASGSSAIGDTKSLLTSEGLQPSYNDLDHLFDDNMMGDDNSNDESIQVNTPPASNNSVQGSSGGGASGSSVTTVSVNMNTNLVGLAGGPSVVLTPPSLEVSSPCGGALSDGGGGSGLLSSDIEMKVAIAQDPVNVPQYPNLGSPMEEPIEDWSFVFLPAKRSALVGSSKYAPMTDLPSQSLPPIQMSINCVYEASWERKPKPMPQPPMKPIKTANNKENINQNPLMMQKAGGVGPLMNIKQEPQIPGSPMGSSDMNMGMTSGGQSSASVTNPMLTAQLSRPSPLQVPLLGPGGIAPSPLLHGPPLLRGMSPMGPQFSPNPMQHPMTQQMPYRRTPLAPPPPYELAVSSPANHGGPNFSGMVPGGPASGGGNSEMMHQMHMQRMMMSQQQQQQHMMGGNVFPGPNSNSGGGMMGGTFAAGMMGNNNPGMMMGSNHMLMSNSSAASSSPVISLPEADSLLVNVLLYDTVLNIFRDHNFDSCTMCVCTSSTHKCVGNIRGSDSGVYLPLPGTTFAQMTSELSRKVAAQMNANNGGYNGGGGGYDQSGGMDPAALNGYLDEDPVKCECGFSAVVNRRLAHKSGLFYEDEMEITGMAVDPVVHKKRSLLSFVTNELQKVDGGRSDTNNNVTPAIKQEPGVVPLNSSRSNTPMGASASLDVGEMARRQMMMLDSPRNNAQQRDSADGPESLPLAIMELLRDQCATLVQSSSSSILRAIKRFDRISYSVGTSATISRTVSVSLNMLEYTEAHDVISLALEQARITFETSSGSGTSSIKMEMDPFGNPMPGNPHQMMRVNNGPLSSTSSIGSGSAMMRPSFGGGCGPGGNSNSQNSMSVSHGNSKLTALVKNGSFNVHKWPYVNAKGPRSNQDIIRLMKSMQPILQDAFHKECKTRLWDAPYTVKGPLTWRQFNRLASSSTTDQCEPQPIPSVIVGHERDWLSLSPYALQYWDKLLLEPYSYSRDIAYIVVAPDNDFIVGKVKTFFKELSTTYEMCKLGRHTPIKGWDGVFRVGKTMKHIVGVTNDSPASSAASAGADDWFTTLGESKVAESLRLYYQACQSYLVPYLAKVPGDKTLLDPPESYMYPVPPGPYGSNASSAVNLLNKSLPSPMLPPNTPEPSTAEKAPNTPKSSGDGDGDQKDALNTSGGPMLEPLSTVENDDVNPPCIMIYIVEPFTCGNDSPELERLACLSLLRCYASILNSVPESIRANISFQIISQESVCELGRSRNQMRLRDEMRCLSLSVFSQCRRYLTHVNQGKSLTGFGTAAQMELFLKGKDEKNRLPHRLYTPPYILSSKPEKAERADKFGKKRRDNQSSVLYCSYCLSKDQNWLLAVATDERGELLETATINIDIPNRTRRKKASARLYGLRKLMDFMLGIISQTVQPWRIVVGRIGRIGHGELKGWSFLLSKANLLKASKHLKEICNQCSLLSPGAVPSILSACLTSMEPDSNLRVMPDQFTPDERFSQMSVHNPLSTPQDVSCTHILVFPLSARAQSTQLTIHGDDDVSIMDHEILDTFDEDEDLRENVNGFNDLFSEWDDTLIQQDAGRSRPGSPDLGETMVPHLSSGLPSSNGGGQKPQQQDTEEFGPLSQQPLSLGYLVSTAPMGRMPDWFWAACPHMEGVCPSYLKTALHMNIGAIHSSQDEILQQNHPSSTDHPLDSTYTEVVLRHVMEGYNLLSWLAMDSNTHDRLSCLPIHVQLLMQLYHMSAALT